MSELLRKQVDGVMKMKIPEANASPRIGCEENERRRKKEKDAPTQKILRRRIAKGGEEKWRDGSL